MPMICIAAAMDGNRHAAARILVKEGIFTPAPRNPIKKENIRRNR
jgi:hypothetical protein